MNSELIRAEYLKKRRNKKHERKFSNKMFNPENERSMIFKREEKR